MSENLIEKFAPYPRSEDEVTAEAVYRHLLVAAQITYLERARTKDSEARYQSIAQFIAEWSTLHLLRKLLGLPYTDGSPMPDTADGVVRDMWVAWDDGSDMAPALWEWLEQADLDPEAITRAYEASKEVRADG